ncbi:MAG: XRE family transcriptional regulator [Bryobacteraceae bacterium]|jgi:transcriptional regulator with XRE-family HTH domain
MPGFRQLESRLVSALQERIRRGELTERGTARLTGLSQPHIHNVLKGKRSLSMDAADIILVAVRIDTVDLFQSSELVAGLGRR